MYVRETTDRLRIALDRCGEFRYSRPVFYDRRTVLGGGGFGDAHPDNVRTPDAPRHGV